MFYYYLFIDLVEEEQCFHKSLCQSLIYVICPHIERKIEVAMANIYIYINPQNNPHDKATRQCQLPSTIIIIIISSLVW